MPLHALIKIHIALSLIFATHCHKKKHCPADITLVSVSFKKDLRGFHRHNLHELPPVGGLVVTCRSTSLDSLIIKPNSTFHTRYFNVDITVLVMMMIFHF